MTSGPASHSTSPGPGGASVFARIGARFRRWDAHGRLTLLGITLVAVFGIGAAVWGGVVADPHFTVQALDAGPVTSFAIGRVAPYPDVNVYLVGIEDGRIRALDGIVKDTGCAVRWDPADERTRSANAGRFPGSYTDPCSGNVWTNTGNAFSGAKSPLRTFQVSYETNDQGVQHVWVEVIGERAARP